MSAAETTPDGKPMVGPFDRAGWRTWLIDNHAASNGVFLVSWRPASGRSSVPYDDAVEEALCVGWVDSFGKAIDADRSIQWFSPRRSRSAWARSNKERVERLLAAGLMLPAGLAAIEDAKRTGMWSILDDVENGVVPEDLVAALDGRPEARANWDSFSQSARRAMLEWVVQARRPETRSKRITAIAESAARKQKAYPPVTD